MNDDMHERIQARWIASNLLNLPQIDPEGSNFILARQYMHALEKIERLTRIVNRHPRLGADAELVDKWPAPEKMLGWPLMP
jgi:hypothetical protein